MRVYVLVFEMMLERVYKCELFIVRMFVHAV